MSDAAKLRTRITEATKKAMKEKDTLRVSTLRLVSAAVKDRDIAARAEDRCEGIDEGEILSLLSKMVKQRKESAQTYEENGRPELAEREREEIDIIQEFMPQPLSEDEMKTIIAGLVEAAAHWLTLAGFDVVWPIYFRIAAISQLGPPAYPIRQPVIA